MNAGAKAETSKRHTIPEAKPAAKLLTFGFSDGRYRKPEPDECGGIMKISYFPGGKPEDVVPAVDFGASPCGGGGGGGPLIVAGCCYTDSSILCQLKGPDFGFEGFYEPNSIADIDFGVSQFRVSQVVSMSSDHSQTRKANRNK